MLNLLFIYKSVINGFYSASNWLWVVCLSVLVWPQRTSVPYCWCLNLLVLFFFTSGCVCNVSYRLIYDGEYLYVMMITV